MQARSPESDNSFPGARKYVFAAPAVFSLDPLIGASSVAATAKVVAVRGVDVGDIDSRSEVDLSSAAAPYARISHFNGAGGRWRESWSRLRPKTGRNIFGAICYFNFTRVGPRLINCRQQWREEGGGTTCQ